MAQLFFYENSYQYDSRSVVNKKAFQLAIIKLQEAVKYRKSSYWVEVNLSDKDSYRLSINEQGELDMPMINCKQPESIGN